jgi:ABC-type Fe3+-siderophore transport system permease subunit
MLHRDVIWRRISAILVLIILAVFMRPLGGVSLVYLAEPVTISGAITSNTGANIPIQSDDLFHGLVRDYNLLPTVIGIIIGIILVIAGIVYRIGYNRPGGEKVIVERDGRLGESQERSAGWKAYPPLRLCRA